jgi:hypothetical protein
LKLLQAKIERKERKARYVESCDIRRPASA